FVIAPIGYIAQAFFPAPGGVGGGEAIFGYLYTLLGRPLDTGVIGRLTMRLVDWSFGFTGYMVYLWVKEELPAVEAEAGEGGGGGGGDGRRGPGEGAKPARRSGWALAARKTNHPRGRLPLPSADSPGWLCLRNPSPTRARHRLSPRSGRRVGSRLAGPPEAG